MIPKAYEPPMMKDDPNMPLEFRKHKDKCKGKLRDMQERIFLDGYCNVVDCHYWMKQLIFCCADKYNYMSYSCHLFMDPKRKDRYDNYYHYYDRKINFDTYAKPYAPGGRWQ